MTIKVGMLGADSSHTDVYIGLMNPVHAPFHSRAKVTKLWGANLQEATSKAMPGIQVVNEPGEALVGVDLAMICARWGEDHLPLAKVALACGIPTYIDKPLVNSLDEAKEILKLATDTKVLCFSSSPFRFAEEVADIKAKMSLLGDYRGLCCSGLARYLPLGSRAQNIYFYGVHSVEILHALMGPGMKSAIISPGREATIVTVRYADGRQCTLQLLEDCSEVYQATYFGSEGTANRNIALDGSFYSSTLEAILSMVETDTVPVPLFHSVEIIALLSAIERALLAGTACEVGISI